MPFNKINLDSDASVKLQNLTTFYNSLETTLTSLEDCREKFLAITNLEQSYMWTVKAVEREQLERNFKNSQTVPQPQTPVPQVQVQPQAQAPVQVPQSQVPAPQALSPDAAVLAESRAKLETLIEEIKKLKV